jgi:hypothetical protein
MVQMSDLNAAYKMKFGFPFIIVVRMHTRGILFEFLSAGCKMTLKPNSPTICKMSTSLPYG